MQTEWIARLYIAGKKSLYKTEKKVKFAVKKVALQGKV